MPDIFQPVVLSIAGSDNTGGAGIQADIKTCCAFRTYAATVITGVTAQNSRKVFGVEPVSEKMLTEQIDSIFEVMRPKAVKTGMLPTPGIIRLVACKLREYQVGNIVVDPVMVATNGGSLVNTDKETISMFISELLPLATIVTPNISEASRFLSKDVSTMNPHVVCTELLNTFQSRSLLLKGGHSAEGEASDYLYDGKAVTCFSGPRIDTANTHGTGCTLSSAIACGLAIGLDLTSAVAEAKGFIGASIRAAKDLNIMKGPGPLDFFVRDEKTNN